eukprot:gene8597-1152_t
MRRHGLFQCPGPAYFARRESMSMFRTMFSQFPSSGPMRHELPVVTRRGISSVLPAERTRSRTAPACEPRGAGRVRILRVPRAHARAASSCACRELMRMTRAHARDASSCACRELMRVPRAHAHDASSCACRELMRMTRAHAHDASSCACRELMRVTRAHAHAASSCACRELMRMTR